METQANRGVNAPTDQAPATATTPFFSYLTLSAASAEENVDTAKEHTKSKRPPTQHRGTEHEWYEGIPNGQPKWREVMV